MASVLRQAPERSRHPRHQITIAPIAVLATGASNHHIHAMFDTVNGKHTRAADARRTERNGAVPDGRRVKERRGVRWKRSLPGTLPDARPLTLT